MKTSWEKTSDGITYYVHITEDQVVSGSHAGSGHTDSAGTCSYREFLNGQFHDIIRNDFGPALLEEVISSVKAAETWEPFMKKRAESDGRRAFIYNIPFDGSLEDILHDPCIERGGRYYGITGSYDTELQADGYIFRTDTSDISSITGTVTHTLTGEVYNFSLPGYCTAVVAAREKFFLISSNNFMVINSRGEILWTTADLKDSRGENLIGDNLRAGTVMRCEERIIVSFSWVGGNDRRSWLLFDPDGMSFTGRYTEGAD